MKQRALLDLLHAVRDGRIDPVRAAEQLSFSEIDGAMIDHARLYRKGYPETIFGENKTAEQITAITGRFLANDQMVLITRIDASKTEHLLHALDDDRKHGRLPRRISITSNPLARTVTIRAAAESGADTDAATDTGAPRGAGDAPDCDVAIVAAGTSDLPVVEECYETLVAFGYTARKIVDVGVAGIHRLFARLDDIKKARVVIVVAGMEGALASVLGGLVDRPIIAVPTSVGYGASFGGVSALLTMLNSCASGVSVVNIDNGYGAAYCAAQILRAVVQTDPLGM